MASRASRYEAMDVHGVSNPGITILRALETLGILTLSFDSSFADVIVIHIKDLTEPALNIVRALEAQGSLEITFDPFFRAPGDPSPSPPPYAPGRPLNDSEDLPTVSSSLDAQPVSDTNPLDPETSLGEPPDTDTMNKQQAFK